MFGTGPLQRGSWSVWHRSGSGTVGHPVQGDHVITVDALADALDKALEIERQPSKLQQLRTLRQ